MAKIKIIVENHTTYSLQGDIKFLTRLYKAFKIKKPSSILYKKEWSNAKRLGWMH